MEGTCIWWKNAYGFLGIGIVTNNSYEGQIYAHYKNIARKGLKNPAYRELAPGDVCEFTEGPGFFNDGTQALKIKVVSLAEDRDERQAVRGRNAPDEVVDERGLEEVAETNLSSTDPALSKYDAEGSRAKRPNETRERSDDEQPDKARGTGPKSEKDSKL